MASNDSLGIECFQSDSCKTATIGEAALTWRHWSHRAVKLTETAASRCPCSCPRSTPAPALLLLHCITRHIYPGLTSLIHGQAINGLQPFRQPGRLLFVSWTTTLPGKAASAPSVPCA